MGNNGVIRLSPNQTRHISEITDVLEEMEEPNATGFSISTGANSRIGEFQRTNRNARLQEIGATGIDVPGGILNFSPITELRWPSAYTIFNRLRRTDPEVAMVRAMLTVLSRSVKLKFKPGDNENVTDGDKEAIDYLESMFDEIVGGTSSLIDSMVGYTPFMGWSWWELNFGFRNGRKYGNSDWISVNDDGLPAIIEFAWRDHSTFHSWEFDDTGRLKGMEQLITQGSNPGVKFLPKDKALHLVYGDPVSPEGLSPLEALYRLERIKHGLEVVFGIGSEHTAGHLSVTSEVRLRPKDKNIIQTAANNVLRAQEGNFAVWPVGYKGEIVDSTFSAARDLLEAIRYYGILKLQVYMMQFIAMASTAGTGAYNATADSSEMALNSFNSMMEGFANGLNTQVIQRLFRIDAIDSAFSDRSANPIAYFSKVEKSVNLSDFASLLKAIDGMVPLGSDDLVEIRKRSGFLAEELPDEEDIVPSKMEKEAELNKPPEPQESETDEQPEEDDEDEMEGEELEDEEAEESTEEN